MRFSGSEAAGNIFVTTVPETTIATGENKAGAKKLVKIVAINDNRIFTKSRKVITTPSLKNDPITNKRITIKAIGQTMERIGATETDDDGNFIINAAGNVYLDSTQNIKIVMAKIVTSVLSEKGYKIIRKKNPNYKKAIPIIINIDKFWTWTFFDNDGTTIHFDMDVKIAGPIMKSSESIKINLDNRIFFLKLKAYDKVIKQGIDSFRKKLLKSLKNP